MSCGGSSQVLEAARKESEVVHSGAPDGMGRNGDGQSAIAFDTFIKSVLILYSRNSISLGIDFCLSVFCKVLEQIIKGFRAAITKNTHFLAKKGQKKPFSGSKQCFWALSSHR